MSDTVVAEDRLVRTNDLVRRSGASFRRVDYWTRVGLLEPANPHEQGSGSVRLYGPREVAVARVLALLSDANLLGGGGAGRGPSLVSRQVAAHVRAHGLVGKVDLVPDRPGLLVIDLEVL